jgi:hypothetical protein
MNLFVFQNLSSITLQNYGQKNYLAKIGELRLDMYQVDCVKHIQRPRIICIFFNLFIFLLLIIIAGCTDQFPAGPERRVNS